MAKLNSIARFLNKELKVKSIPDGSRNGLQVKTTKDIKKIGFAVDACLETFKKAKKAKVDLLIVHHGLLWKGQKYKELTKKRISFLKKSKIALYGVHLPLDAHKKYGNNIKLCEILNLQKIKRFGRYNKHIISYQGILSKEKTTKAIANILDITLKTKCKIYPFGKKNIKSVALCSGYGIDLLSESVKKGVDLFIVGETDHNSVNRTKDYKINVIEAGHYATETVGVKALMPLIKEKLNIQTVFIDNPTGL